MVSASFSSSLSQEIRDVLKYPVGTANLKLPDVTPVIDVNPKHARVANIVRGQSRTITGSVTIYTTPASQDFYLTAVTLSGQKDVANDAATGVYASIVATIDGAVQVLVSFAGITLTAMYDSVALSLPTPIKIDRNTAIQIGGNSYTAGAGSRSAVIHGYVVDNSNA